jgi:hypothetical protein
MPDPKRKAKPWKCPILQPYSLRSPHLRILSKILTSEAGHPWFTFVILATWEAEIERIMVWGQCLEIVHKTHISKITRAKWTGGVVQEEECLLCKCTALSSKPQSHQKKKKKILTWEFIIVPCKLSTNCVRWLIHSLTHSLISSLPHSLINSLTHSFTHSLTHSLTHLLTYLLTHFLTHSLISSLTHFLTHSLPHSLTHSLTPSFTHSLTQIE